MPSTPSSRAMSFTGRWTPLKRMAEVRETRRSEVFFANMVMSSSRHSVGEVILRRITGEICQGKHRQGVNGTDRMRREDAVTQAGDVESGEEERQ